MPQLNREVFNPKQDAFTAWFEAMQFAHLDTDSDDISERA